MKLTILILACLVSFGAMAQTNFLPVVYSDFIQKNMAVMNYSIFVTNKSYPASFQPPYNEDITNIVIAPDFKGTVQVGSEFYHITTKTNIIKKTITVTNVIKKLQ